MPTKRRVLMRCTIPLTVNGMVQAPRELMEQLGWVEGERLTAKLTDDNQGIAFYRSEEVCAHCGYPNDLVRVVRRGEPTGTCICKYCFEAVERSRKENETE